MKKAEEENDRGKGLSFWKPAAQHKVKLAHELAQALRSQRSAVDAISKKKKEKEPQEESHHPEPNLKCFLTPPPTSRITSRNRERKKTATEAFDR